MCWSIAIYNKDHVFIFKRKATTFSQLLRIIESEYPGSKILSYAVIS